MKTLVGIKSFAAVSPNEFALVHSFFTDLSNFVHPARLAFARRKQLPQAPLAFSVSGAQAGFAEFAPVSFASNSEPTDSQLGICLHF